MAKQNIPDIFANLRERLVPVLSELPRIIGNAGVNYTLEAFEKQAWENVPWQQRKDKKNTRALLIKSGRLKRSVRVIRTTENSIIWGTDVPYAQVHNDGLAISRAARSETFVRPRYERGPKSKLFGGKGAFRKMTADERSAGPAKGQTYKASNGVMPRRRFMGDTPELRQYLMRVTKEELSKIFKP